MSEALRFILYLCNMVTNKTIFPLWTINLFLLLQSMQQAVAIHLGLKLIAMCVSFLVMIWRTLPTPHC